jgi:hypothetical protein
MGALDVPSSALVHRACSSHAEAVDREHGKLKVWALDNAILEINNVLIQRMPFPDMLRLVALVRTDVSEERIASIIRVTNIGELGTTLVVTRNRRTLRSNTI